MPYRYLEEIATADVAFEAWGKDLEELFISAADAAMNVMVEDLGSIKRRQGVEFKLEGPEIDLLLFNFLNELVYYKDAKKLLLRVDKAALEEKETGFTLEARAWGEVLNPEEHDLRADVKAVTLHLFNVEKTADGWKAKVILDI